MKGHDVARGEIKPKEIKDKEEESDDSEVVALFNNFTVKITQLCVCLVMCCTKLLFWPESLFESSKMLRKSF